MSNIKIGIVGTNFISDLLCEAAGLVDGIEISAVYSRKLDTGAHFAAKHGIKTVFDDYNAMVISNTVDAVYIASPTFLHRDHTVAALDAGKHVLCEKSISTSAAEFADMKAAAERSGKVLLEAMRPAHDPIYDLLREELSKLGRVKSASLEFKKYSSRYDNFKRGIVENAFNPEMKNSALLDIGVYPMWLAISLFGAPTSVSSVSKRLSNGFDADGTVTLAYPDFECTVGYSKIVDGTSPSVIKCESGSIILDKISEPTIFTVTTENGAKTVKHPTPCNNNMVFELASFRDMILDVRDFSPFLATTEQLVLAMDLAVLNATYTE